MNQKQTQKQEASRSRKIRWKLLLPAATLCKGLLIAAAFLWVAIYAHLLRPGQDFEAIQSYAQTASPWVAAFVGLPLFFFLGRWLASRIEALSLTRNLLVLVGITLALDVVMIAASQVEFGSAIGLCLTIQGVTLATLFLGARTSPGPLEREVQAPS